MSDFERINRPRVDAIMAKLDLIDKSARSMRKHGDFDHAALLMPILERLQEIGSDVVQDVIAAPAAPAASSASPHRTWADAVQMAREAPLEQAVAAMGVIANRVEQELYERRQK